MARYRNTSRQDLEVPALGQIVKAGGTVEVPASLREQFDESPIFDRVVAKKTAAKKRAAKKAAATEPTAPSDAAGITAESSEGDSA